MHFSSFRKDCRFDSNQTKNCVSPRSFLALCSRFEVCLWLCLSPHLLPGKWLGVYGFEAFQRFLFETFMQLSVFTGFLRVGKKQDFETTKSRCPTTKSRCSTTDCRHSNDQIRNLPNFNDFFDFERFCVEHVKCPSPHQLRISIFEWLFQSRLQKQRHMFELPFHELVESFQTLDFWSICVGQVNGLSCAMDGLLLRCLQGCMRWICRLSNGNCQTASRIWRSCMMQTAYSSDFYVGRIYCMSFENCKYKFA